MELEMIMSMSKEELQLYVLTNENNKLKKEYDEHEDKEGYENLKRKLQFLSDINQSVEAECPELEENVKYKQIIDKRYELLDKKLKAYDDTPFMTLKKKIETNGRMIYNLEQQVEAKKKKEAKKLAKKGM